MSKRSAVDVEFRGTLNLTPHDEPQLELVKQEPEPEPSTEDLFLLCCARLEQRLDSITRSLKRKRRSRLVRSH